jgi:hypothetical protein
MSFSQENINSFFVWANVQHIEYEMKQLFEMKEQVMSNTPIGNKWTMEQYLSGIISQYINTRFSK